MGTITKCPDCGKLIALIFSLHVCTPKKKKYTPKLIGYIVRSKQNRSMILCTNGEWHHENIVGPGCDYGAKLYKTKARAAKVRGGKVIIEEQWA